jgi:polyphosphate kinase
MNALVEPQIIQALYQAAMAGVKVDLIVRGICALRPGIRGVSENIHVRSIIGRFLEHSRVYYFLNDGDSELYCSSADWMERNFFRRIEVGFPIENPIHRNRILEDLETYLSDNTGAWELQSDGSYRRLMPNDSTAVNAQSVLLQRYAESPGP